jgi:hypothetical protein
LKSLARNFQTFQSGTPSIGPFHLIYPPPPLWTRISGGGWKSRFWGVVCIGILWSLRFFWGERQTFLNFCGGCLCRHLGFKFYWPRP